MVHECWTWVSLKHKISLNNRFFSLSSFFSYSNCFPPKILTESNKKNSPHPNLCSLPLKTVAPTKSIQRKEEVPICNFMCSRYDQNTTIAIHTRAPRLRRSYAWSVPCQSVTKGEKSFSIVFCSFNLQINSTGHRCLRLPSIWTLG